MDVCIIEKRRLYINNLLLSGVKVRKGAVRVDKVGKAWYNKRKE